uniref:CidA/LrgA family protein n=1 Tax=Alistipes putredinis TaxID=28117 RepID=UPI00349F7B15
SPRQNANKNLLLRSAYSYLCHVLAGLFYILFCWALGNGVSLLIGGYLPGSIVGMILLFASLCLHIVDAEMIRPAARFLLGAMALFFIPYGVGLMVSYEVLLDNFWAIVISGGVSTMLVLVCVGRVFQKLNKKA